MAEKLKKHEKTAKIILCILLFLTTAFIWGHSCMPPAQSTEESDFVKEIIDTVVQSVSGNEQFSIPEVVVRKCAHFFEYAILGTELISLILLIKKEKKAMPVMVFPFAIALFIASVDETIQYFSGRYSSVFDVCLDFVGASFAIIIIYFLVSMHKKKK